MKKVYILPKLKLLKTVTHSNIVAREFEEDGGEGWESFTGTVTNWTKGQLKRTHKNTLQIFRMNMPYMKGG